MWDDHLGRTLCRIAARAVSALDGDGVDAIVAAPLTLRAKHDPFGTDQPNVTIIGFFAGGGDDFARRRRITHIVGFKSALTRVINSYASKRDLVKGKESITGDDIREGLTAVISVWITEPQFEGQTKSQLGNSEVKGQVEHAVGDAFSTYLQENPTPGKKIIERAAAAARAREAAKRARDIESKKAGLSSSLPGKLTDCSDKNPENCELFIVEGDSAAGPAKNARNRNFQAILPIRGKILNVEKASMHKVLQKLAS